MAANTLEEVSLASTNVCSLLYPNTYLSVTSLTDQTRNASQTVIDLPEAVLDNVSIESTW